MTLGLKHVCPFIVLSYANNSFPRRLARQTYRYLLYQFFFWTTQSLFWDRRGRDTLHPYAHGICACDKQRSGNTPTVRPSHDLMCRFILPDTEEETRHEDTPLHAQAGLEQ